MNTHDEWNTEYYQSSPIFQPLLDSILYLDSISTNWPSLKNYNACLQYYHESLLSKANAPLRFVAQDKKCVEFEQRFQSRIYLDGEIQTRLNNWHDYFNSLVWINFPRAKTAINQRHYFAAQQTHRSNPNDFNKGPIENTLSLFDECGAVVVTTDQELLDLIKEFKWSELFIDNRDRLKSNAYCFIFGHAIYEKALSPYVGLTANAILCKVDENVFAACNSCMPDKDKMYQLNNLDQYSNSSQLHLADKLIAETLGNEHNINHTKQFSPLPILGWPGWYEGNNNMDFYNNISYFRSGRRKT